MPRPAVRRWLAYPGSGCILDQPLDRLLQRHPRRRRRLAALAALARRRAQVPARPDRIRPDAAAGHLGPARPALGRAAHHGRHRARAPRRGRGAAARARRRTTSCSRASRATRRPPSAWPPRSSNAASPDVIIGSFAADHVISGDGAVPRGRRRGRRGRASRLHRDDRHHADRARRRLRLHPVRRRRSASTGAERAEAVVELRREARPRDREALPRRAATTSGTPACSSPGADRLLDELARTKPELHAGLLELAAAWDDPATRGPAVDRIWPELEKIAIDYAVAEPAAAAGRLAVVRGHFDVGRRRRLRLAREAQLRRAQSASSRSSARTPGCSPTPRAASS